MSLLFVVNKVFNSVKRKFVRLISTHHTQLRITRETGVKLVLGPLRNQKFPCQVWHKKSQSEIMGITLALIFLRITERRSFARRKCRSVTDQT